MKYYYEIVNVPWVNSTVNIWPENQPENKSRLVCLGLRHPGGYDEHKLIDIIKRKFNEETVEVERVE